MFLPIPPSSEKLIRWGCGFGSSVLATATAAEAITAGLRLRLDVLDLDYGSHHGKPPYVDDLL